MSWLRHKIDDPTFERSTASHVTRVSIMDDMGKFTASDDFSLGSREGDDDLFGEDVYKPGPGETVSPHTLTTAEARGVHWFDYLNPRYWLDHRGWVANNLIIPSQRAAYLAAHGEFGAEGGAVADFMNWARSTPDFIPWAQRQGQGWANLLEAVGSVSPEHWEDLSHAYAIQMKYMRQRWPSGMSYLHAAVWRHS